MDQLRYFFLREIPFGQDGNYSHEAIVNRINADFVKILGLPEVRARMNELGITVVGNSAEEYDAVIRSEIARWSKLIKEAGIKVE